jgi:hypothetical protein
MFMRTLVLGMLLGLGALSSVLANPAETAERILPSLTTILSSHGKSTSSAEFLELVNKCKLRLFSRSQKVSLIEDGPAKTPFPIFVTESYGGSGLIIEATHETYVASDLNSFSGALELKVSHIKLIVGMCDEAEMFGLWKGEMPKVEIPSTPEALLAIHRHFDSDIMDVKYASGVPMERTRVINYYIPTVRNSLRFSFVFWGRDSKIAMIEIWPPHPPYKIIAPQRPKD